MSAQTTIKEMIADLHHGDGGRGYSIVYFDRELGTIKTSLGDFDKCPAETNRAFLKRVKQDVLEACEVDTVITVSN